MFKSGVLAELKRECGGLQTLLRSWPQVFHGGFGMYAELCRASDFHYVMSQFPIIT